MTKLTALSTSAKRTLILAHTHVQALKTGNVLAYYEDSYSSHSSERMARGCACFNEYVSLGYSATDIELLYRAIAI